MRFQGQAHPVPESWGIPVALRIGVFTNWVVFRILWDSLDLSFQGYIASILSGLGSLHPALYLSEF
jgi:hypothetical protein